MKLIYCFSTIALLVNGFHFNQINPIQKENSGSSMWTTTKTVYRDEKIDLQFALPHAQNLGVIDPDGKFYYVIFPAANAYGKLQPFITSEDFVKIKSLQINTKSFKADPYTYGVEENVPVFTKSGTYRFVLGNDLHIDDESALTVVKVEYYHLLRA